MVKNLQKYILGVSFFLFLQTSHAENIEGYLQIVKQYQLAYNNADFSLLNSYTFTSVEYTDLITKIENQYPDCLTDFDKTFDVTVFKREFEKSHLSKLKTDTIIISKVSEFSTCSNLEIKKLSCYAYFKKQNKSVPVTLIIINLSEGERKILLDIINENYFESKEF